MKITFNPSLKPWKISITELEIITCPKCGSEDVWTHTFIHAYGWVNLNTAVVEEEEDGEADIDDARSKEDRVCYKCHHEWVNEA